MFLRVVWLGQGVHNAMLVDRTVKLVKKLHEAVNAGLPSLFCNVQACLLNMRELLELRAPTLRSSTRPLITLSTVGFLEAGCGWI